MATPLTVGDIALYSFHADDGTQQKEGEIRPCLITGVAQFGLYRGWVFLHGDDYYATQNPGMGIERETLALYDTPTPGGLHNKPGSTP